MNRHTLFLLPLLLLLAFALGSCDSEDNYDAVYVNLNTDVPFESDSTSHRNMVSGKNYRFDITAIDYKKRALKQLTLKSHDPERGEVILLDTMLSTASVSFTYYYQAPEQLAADTLSISFVLTATDVTGESCRIGFGGYRIIQEDRVLTAYAGVTMYEREADEHPNGYCFRRRQAIRTSLSEVSDVDIFAALNEQEEGTEAMTRQWKTQTGVYFAKNNSFDFATATRRNVAVTFAAATSYHVVADLQDGDVILVGNEEGAIGVIKIQKIYDEPGTTQDRYTFDVKLCK